MIKIPLYDTFPNKTVLNKKAIWDYIGIRIPCRKNTQTKQHKKIGIAVTIP
jgi:hypothetical protein